MENKEQKSNSALREEEILKFWKEREIFQKSLNKKSTNGEYVFYEGPPTANGKPGIHHLEARAFKDIIPRYKTMLGYHVRRKGGWDTHGLPVELQVEKALGLDSKKAIEEYGIDKFNQKCKESVWEYLEYWNNFTERIGYWVDQKNPYITYHNDYIESVWNVIKEANNKKLLYKDYKVVPWCPRCGTGLSSHELAQGYQDIKDLSVYVKFKLKVVQNHLFFLHFTPEIPYATQKSNDISPVYILAWTTTPWTLPGNVALAVGKDIDYVALKKDNEIFILAKSRLFIIAGEYTILQEFKGSDLIGLEYEPLYPFLENTISEGENLKLEKAFKVYDANFVTTEDGTGVVHTAVMYGQDDFVLGNDIGLPKHHLVGLDGKFLHGTGFLEGRFVREINENGKPTLAVDIIEDLKKRNLFFKQENYEHSYPHCWRCKTALIYYARDSWYIKMTDLRDQMVEENKTINWEPSYIKDGRFGEWLRDIKDWAISRERYWGTPLPVWTCDKCKKVEVLGSLDDIKSKVKKSQNRYFAIRHGEASNNTSGIISININSIDHLTEKGKIQVIKSSKNLKDLKFDYIFSSPILRTKETAEILKSELGIDNEIIFDKRLIEYNVGDYDGKKVEEYDALYINEADQFTKSLTNGETLNDLKRRVGSFLEEIEQNYENKNILIVSHGDTIWMMNSVVNMMNVEESLNFAKDNYPINAEVRELNFIDIPHNENYELDLHRPYIDEINLFCSCGEKLERSKEVMDVWLDSGTMPFSQDHYPFENKELINGSGYPADFISEAIDQTRGWFYTLHAVGSIMGKGKAYKNVICLGHLLDEKGKKMSKSLGNIVDPFVMMDRYGVDTLRLWMYSVNQPGEPKNFDEKTVSELHNKVFNLLYNVLSFYELYRDKNLEEKEYKISDNILDQWIVVRLGGLLNLTTTNLNEYKVLEPVRAMRLFIDDLSTWYLRRSRERIKEGDTNAKETLYFVLKNLIKIMAPFTPFASEYIWKILKNDKDEESVHLTDWPKKELLLDNEELILEEMDKAREIVTFGLQSRQKIGIPVRQPLNKITIVNERLNDEYIEILKEELNIKNVDFTTGEDKQVILDPSITEDLKQEGDYRLLVRAIQDMRKKMGLNPSDFVSIEIDTNLNGQNLIKKFENELKKAVGSNDIKIKENDGEEIKLSEISFTILIINNNL